MNLADALAPKNFSDGEQIIRQGDMADGMYFVEDGVVRITIIGDNGREVEVNKINIHFIILFLFYLSRLDKYLNKFCFLYYNKSFYLIFCFID